MHLNRIQLTSWLTKDNHVTVFLTIFQAICLKSVDDQCDSMLLQLMLFWRFSLMDNPVLFFFFPASGRISFQFLFLGQMCKRIFFSFEDDMK